MSLKSKGKVSDFFLYGLVFDFLVKCGNINDVETLWNEINDGFEVKIDKSDYVIHVAKRGGLDEVMYVCERITRSGRVLRKELCCFDWGVVYSKRMAFSKNGF